MDKNNDYLLLYGFVAHSLFYITFLSVINKKNTRRLFLVLGHILVSITFIIRFIYDGSEEKISQDDTNKNIFPYIGIAGHSIICIFFIATTIIENMNYRVVSSNILLNLLCIFGQIGMIIHYVTIKLNSEDSIIYRSINIITCTILFIFYLSIALKQKKEDRILIPPVFMISLLYLGFSLRRFSELIGYKGCLI